MSHLVCFLFKGNFIHTNVEILFNLEEYLIIVVQVITYFVYFYE